jgi:putative ABC transport system permease protein
MRRVVVSELVHRRSRTLALLLGILVATAAFTVLTGTSETQRLEARGTVERSFRGDYDVLVRPRGSRSPIERRTGQAPPNFLSELSEGISTLSGVGSSGCRESRSRRRSRTSAMCSRPRA